MFIITWFVCGLIGGCYYIYDAATTHNKLELFDVFFALVLLFFFGYISFAAALCAFVLRKLSGWRDE